MRRVIELMSSWVTPLLLVGLAILLPRLAGQDATAPALKVCHHGGAGGMNFDPDDALASLRRLNGKFEVGGAKLADIAMPEAVKLPACVRSSEVEREIDFPAFSGFSQLVFADESSFEKAARRADKGAYVLLVSTGPLPKASEPAAKGGLRQGIAAKELVELFGVRCVPTIVSPIAKNKFRISSLARE